jgi:hypothetical protein
MRVVVALGGNAERTRGAAAIGSIKDIEALCAATPARRLR